MGFIVALMLSVLVLPQVARAASFTPLGELPGGQDASFGAAVSADGAVVVGLSDDAVDNRAFRWSGGVMTSLGVLPASVSSTATGVSAGGSVVVGESSGDEISEAYRWSSGTMTGLGFLPDDSQSRAMGVSANGGVVVGYSFVTDLEPEAFRWFDGTMTGLGFLANDTYSVANGVSANGEVVVGVSSGLETSTAFRWSNGAMSSLSDFPDWVSSSEGAAASGDGAFVVGSMAGDPSTEAFRWTEGEMLGLGFLSSDPSYGYSWARSVSGDGAVVVGSSLTDSNDNAFVWSESNGMQQLSALLAANGATGLEGWVLLEAAGVSADGRWVTGWGINPDGDSEAFLADISPVPAPPASWLLGSAIVAWACARRRSAA